MKKILLGASILFVLNSCIVSTAAKVATTGVKAATGIVKGTVKGVAWTVKKAEGKINENRLDGRWRVVGVYRGSYDALPGEPENVMNNNCPGGEIVEFNAKKSRYKPAHCSSDRIDWENYKFRFGKNPSTRHRENYLELGKGNYVSIVNVDGQNLILEGNLIPAYGLPGGNVYLLEKAR